MTKTEQLFTQEVRTVFFGILEQFLSILVEDRETFFMEPEPDEEKVFLNYFNTAEYLDWFEGTNNKEFASSLMNSMPFTLFCDDLFDKGTVSVSNLLIYLNISKTGYDFDAADETDAEMRKMKEEFGVRMLKIEEDVKCA